LNVEPTLTPHSVVAALGRLDASARLLLDLSLRRELPDDELAARLDKTVPEIGEQRAQAIGRMTSAFEIERIDELTELLTAVAGLSAAGWAAAEGEQAPSSPPPSRRPRTFPFPAARRVAGAALPALLAALATWVLLAGGLGDVSSPRTREPLRNPGSSGAGGNSGVKEMPQGQPVAASPNARTERNARSPAISRRSSAARRPAAGPSAGTAVQHRNGPDKHGGRRTRVHRRSDHGPFGPGIDGADPPPVAVDPRAPGGPTTSIAGGRPTRPGVVAKSQQPPSRNGHPRHRAPHPSEQQPVRPRPDHPPGGQSSGSRGGDKVSPGAQKK
jgi:hypothetical protein